MVTLIDKVYSLTQRATAELRINNRRITDWISIKGGDHEDNPVPYLEVRLPTFVGISRGQHVTCDAGYDNLHIRVFTGGVFARGNEDPDALRTQCFVRGATDEEGNTIDALASVINPPPMWPPIPDGQFIDFEISDSLIWEAENAGEIAVEQLQRQATIPNRPSGTPLSQIVHCLGDLKGAYRSYKIPARDLSGQMVKESMADILDDCGVSQYQFDFDDYELAPEGAEIDRGPGSEALELLMLLRHVSVRQGPTGVVLFKVIDPRPGSSPSFRYRSDDLDFAYMIDNPGKVKVPFNPYLQRGQTIQVIDEATQVSGMWYLRGVDWELGPNGDFSYMDLVGGEDLGVAIGVNPEAHFIYWVDLEYIDGQLVATVQFDAQSSFDTDGELTDADISWDDNQTPNLISGTGFRKSVSVVVDDIVEPWIVTCTATDEDDLTGTEQQTIDVSFAASAVQMPTIGVAAESHGLFSSPTDDDDGWNDHAEATHTAVGVRPADGLHFGHCLYGYADGHVELTRDSNVTRITVLAAVGSEIRAIAWDWRNTLAAWVLTEDLRLYVSLNMDDAVPTFGLYGGVGLRTTLLLPSAIGKLLGLPAAGGVYVFGGNGNGFPLIAYDAALDNHWVNQIMLGDILADGPGPSDLYIYDYTAPGYGGETMILANAGASEVITGPGEFLMVGSGDVWRLDSGTWTKDADGTQQLAQIHSRAGVLFALEGQLGEGDLVRSVDGGINWEVVISGADVAGEDYPVRDYDFDDAGYVYALRCAVGVGTNSQDDVPLLVYKSDEPYGNTFSIIYTDAGWSGSGFNNVATHGRKIVCKGSGGTGVILVATRGVIAMADIIRSTDGGSTWSNVTVTNWIDVDRFDSFKRVNSGRFILLNAQGTASTCVKYSDDNGSTWIDATFTGPTPGPVRRCMGYWRSTWGNNLIFASDNSPQTSSQIYISTDNGLTWEQIEDGSNNSDLSHGIDYNPDTNEALTASDDPILISDPFGTPSVSLLDSGLPSSMSHEFIDCITCVGAGVGSGSLVCVYHTNDPPGPSRSWTRAVGLPAGLEQGRAILPNGPLADVKRIAIFGDAGNEDAVYKSTDGINYAETTGIIPAGYVVNHAMWLSDVLTAMPAFDGIYLFALGTIAAGTGGIFKSVDECSTELDVVRDTGSADPMPTNSQALQLGIGAGMQTLTSDVSPVIIADFGGATTWDIAILEGAHWRIEELPSAINGARPNVQCLTALDWIIEDHSGFFDNNRNHDIAVRTNDGGFTFDNAELGDEAPGAEPPIGGLAHTAIAANGWIWGIRSTGNSNGDPMRGDIYYSPDRGITWIHVDVYEAPISSRRIPYRIICHPLNANIVAMVGANVDNSNKIEIRVTNNATLGASSSWITNAPVTAPIFDGGHAQIGFKPIMTSSGAIIISVNTAGFGSNDCFIWRSTNQGASWIISQTLDMGGDGHHAWIAGFGNGKIVVAQVDEAGAGTPDGITVHVSLDDGLTFESIANITSPEIAGNFTGNNNSAIYHANSDTLLVAPSATIDPSLWAFSPVSAEGVWRDLTFDLPAVGPFWDQLGVIP